MIAECLTVILLKSTKTNVESCWKTFGKTPEVIVRRCSSK